jgi:hypothetical protein
MTRQNSVFGGYGMRLLSGFAAIALTLALAVASCVRSLDRQLIPPPLHATLDERSPFLKVHGREGQTHVLADWSVDEETRIVGGYGQLLDVDRRVVETGAFEIPIDSVVLFETNVTRTSGVVAGMTVLSGISVAVTIACAANPKACFGSCPTFYTANGEGMALRAEGFSSSIAPSLEKSDIDALDGITARGRTLDVHMLNEALETHVVRHVEVVAAERPPMGRVFATSEGDFWQALDVLKPTNAVAAEGDVGDLLRKVDGVERFSATDSTNLAAREVVELEFANVRPGRHGLVIASRQTLVSTYLLYQTLAYMGRSAVRHIAALERGDSWIGERLQATGRALGTIEVLVQDADGAWIAVGETAETGPLATDVRLVLLPGTSPATKLRVRLRLTRGYWRLDAVQLARLGAAVKPVRLQPASVTREGAEDRDAHARLLDPARTLVTLPGDEYVLTYLLPQDPWRYELFLDSRGYYLEWMREEWLADENPSWAAQMLLDPDSALKRLAPDFKRVEAEMEAQFWGSRYNADAMNGAYHVR